MEDYVDPEFYGLDGEGSCNVNYDSYDLNDDIYDDDTDQKLQERRYNFINSLKLKAEPSEGLSNGDNVTVTFEYDKKDAKKAKIKVKNTELTFTAENLDVPEDVDPFEGLEVTFDGISPKAKLQINKENCHEYVRSACNFTTDTKENLKNGDKIVLHVDYSESSAKNNLVRITQTDKEYTVSGLPEYLTDTKNVDLSPLEQEIEDKISSEIASSLSKGRFFGSGSFGGTSFNANADFTFKGLKADKRCLLTLKEDHKKNGINFLYTFYSLVVSDGTADTPLYFTVYVSNIYKDADGTLNWDKDSLRLDASKNNDLETKHVLAAKTDYNITEQDITKLNVKGLGAD